MSSTLYLLNGAERIEVRVIEEANPPGRRVLILHERHGLVTQVVDYRGRWVDLTGKVLDGRMGHGLFIPLDTETDPVRFAHLLRSWLAGFDRTVPVGAAVWKWFEDQTRAYIVHPQAVQTQVMLQSFLAQLDREIVTISGLNDLLMKSGINDLTVIGPKP